ERFALCGTFKLVLAAAVLARVDAGREDLARPVPYDAAALLEYAPVARAHVGEGALSVAALCEAAVTVSDNTAANLLLGTLGGPAGLTRYFRALGDPVSRLDRDEPTLNAARPGDARDTTTPRAMAHTAARVLVGDALRGAPRWGLRPGAGTVNSATGGASGVAPHSRPRESSRSALLRCGRVASRVALHSRAPCGKRTGLCLRTRFALRQPAARSARKIA